VAESSRPGPDVVHEEIIRQLVTLVRSTAHLPQLAPPDGSPVLERPAFLLLIRLAEQARSGSRRWRAACRWTCPP